MSRYGSLTHINKHSNYNETITSKILWNSSWVQSLEKVESSIKCIYDFIS